MGHPSTRSLIAMALLLSGCAGGLGARDKGGAAARSLPATTTFAERAPFHVLSAAFVPPPSVPTGEPLRQPPVYHNMSNLPHTVEVDATLQSRPIQIANGPPTDTWLFTDTSPGAGGVASFPGPTLQVTEGDNVIFHLHNRLFEPAAVHFHGMIIPIEQDGAPMNLTTQGENHTYRWTAREGFPMTTWYHAHPHGYTHIQVAHGVEACLLVLPKHDPLPAAYGSTIVSLSDLKLGPDNQILPDSEFDRINGREGNVIMVNGQVLPNLTLRPGEIRRLRVANNASARYFNLQIPGVTMLQVGTDGGLINHPVPRQKLLLAPAERAELLVQAPATASTQLTLLDLPYDRGQGIKLEAPIPLMTLTTAGAAVTPPPVPQTLRHIEPLSVAGANQRFFELSFPSFGGGVHHFGLNGRLFDPLRLDNVATYGSTEVITIKNTTGNWDHPMHLHSIQYQVLDVDGVPPDTGPAWKDTVNVPRNKTARIAVRYDGFTGHYMFHCHILQHENDGLMTTVFVTNGPPFQLPSTSNPLPTEHLLAFRRPDGSPRLTCGTEDEGTLADGLPDLSTWAANWLGTNG